MMVMVFPSPINKLHMPVADINQTIPFANTSINDNNMMSFKLFEFIDCEIEPSSIGVMVPSEVNNEAPFQLGKGTIKINYRQCYQHTSNEFDKILWGSDGIFYEYTNSNSNNIYGTEKRIPAMIDNNKAIINHFGNLLVDYAKDNASKLVNKGIGKLLGSTWKNLTTLGYLSGYDEYGPGSKNWKDKVNRLSSKYIHSYTTHPTTNNLTYQNHIENMLSNNLKNYWVNKVNNLTSKHSHTSTQSPKKGGY
jgi:hypothetical protein